jgi:hypothetical protein
VDFNKARDGADKEDIRFEMIKRIRDDKENKK